MFVWRGGGRWYAVERCRAYCARRLGCLAKELCGRDIGCVCGYAKSHSWHYRIGRRRGAIHRAPTLGEIIRAFKARCARGINQLRGAQGLSVWQRNYYEHVIRDESSLQEIREYIANNPAQWAFDRENPDAQFVAPNDEGAINRAPTDLKGIAP